MHQPIDTQRLEEVAAEQGAQAERIAQLEQRIAALEEAAARQVPWSWPYPTWPWPDTITNPVVDGTTPMGCRVCGRGSDGQIVDWLVCTHPQCPGRVTCGTPPLSSPVYIGDPLEGCPGHMHITCEDRSNTCAQGAATAVPPEQLKLAKDVHPPRFGDSVYGR